MIQTIKRVLTSLSILSLFAVPLMAPVAVNAAADVQGNLCSGANLTVNAPPEACAEGGAADTTINNLLTDVINIVSLVVGVVAVIMIIIGGLKYILSGGDSGNVTSAKNTVLFAIVGLVIVALAQFIVRFVIARVGS